MDVGKETRFDRQRSLVPTEKIAQTPVTIVGVGAVGRQLALQLAAMGVREFELIDPETVEWPNVAAQGFATFEIGMHKVDAVAGAIQHFDPLIAAEVVCNRWRPSHETHPVTFCCVDSISARAAIWKGVKSQITFWADARMLAEAIRILVATDDDSRRYYQSTLFDQNLAQPGSCTARSTIYAASIAAGFMCQRFAAWLRNSMVARDIVVNIATSEVAEFAGD